MAVRPEQLPSLLQGELAPLYVIAGAEPLLVQECRDQVIQAAQAQGFAERNVHEVGRGFDWAAMAGDSAALSLFASRKIADVRLPTGKPGRDGAAALVEFAGNPDPDLLLILSCSQWDASSRKSKWAATLGRAGVLVEIWPVKPHELPAWIGRRMSAAGLRAEPDAISLLAEMVEGNLLAAQQEIDKMVMLGGDGTVTAEDVSRAVSDSARFDAFRLVECALAGRLAECLRVAAGLKRTDVAIQAVSGAMIRELALAEVFSRAMQAGENESAAFRRLRIWPARQGPMRQAARRLSPGSLEQGFRALALIDRQSKGRAAGDPWQTLDQLLWFLCEPAAAPVPALA